MFEAIDNKPPCILVNFSPINLLLRAGISILMPEIKFRFFVPEAQDGVPTMMDQTFYFLCPHRYQSGQELVLRFLTEARKRSRIANVIFPEDDEYWVTTLLSSGFLDERDLIEIVGRTAECHGPGSYIQSQFDLRPALVDLLLEKADECSFLVETRLPRLFQSMAQQAGMLSFGTMTRITSDLAHKGLEVLDRDYSHYVGARPPKGAAKKTKRQVRVHECRTLAEARTLIGEVDIIVTARQLLIKVQVAERLIQILGADSAKFDSASGCVIAPRNMLHLVSSLLSGETLSLNL